MCHHIQLKVVTEQVSHTDSASALLQPELLLFRFLKFFTFFFIYIFPFLGVRDGTQVIKLMELAWNLPRR